MIDRWLRLVRRSGVLAAAAGIALPLAPLQGTPAPQEVGSEVASADRQDAADVLYGRPNGAWMSTYRPLPSRPTLIRGATIMTGAGEELEGADLFMRNGRVEAIGRHLEVPAGTEVIEARGRYVTPGIIDTHSHLGVYPSPSVSSTRDGNEATAPNTAEVWAMHSVWPQDPGFTRALAAGVTTLQVLPGSANLVGGRGITLKTVPGRTVQDMMFPGAPMALKMACGENPKRVYGGKGKLPSTRMGNVAGYREAFIEGERYRREWDAWVEGGMRDSLPKRDLAKETIAEVLRGNIFVHNHCYRADEMVGMLNLAREFGFRIRSFHHAVEAYKVRDYLARDSVAASMWVDWWGFKLEAYDAVPQNIALVSEAGARAILHTDSNMGIQVMNQDAARAMYAGRAAGLDVGREDALRWITANPAWALGLDDRIGTLEPGKNADVVIWSGDPFSVYTRADQVFIDGALIYDRQVSAVQPTTDFEVGILPSSARGGER
ncbi:MAG: amidohydrolase [Gemmatimonadota bacterium]|jgi:imidazolonepropionase-like amidohydrolase